jgi:hypothetical protein
VFLHTNGFREDQPQYSKNIVKTAFCHQFLHRNFEVCGNGSRTDFPRRLRI